MYGEPLANNGLQFRLSLPVSRKPSGANQMMQYKRIKISSRNIFCLFTKLLMQTLQSLITIIVAAILTECSILVSWRIKCETVKRWIKRFSLKPKKNSPTKKGKLPEDRRAESQLNWRTFCWPKSSPTQCSSSLIHLNVLLLALCLLTAQFVVV